MSKDRFNFRFYDKENNVMIYPENNMFIGRSFRLDLGDMLLRDRFIPMQYIGINDKNRKPICEGDIVKSDFDFITNTINPLRFKIGNVIYSDYIAGFVVASDINDYSPYKTSFFGKTEALNCIVIGNIYENKDLLERTN